MNNLKQLGLANNIYAQQYGGRYVPSEGGPYEAILLDGTTRNTWMWCYNPTFLKLLDQRTAENAGFDLDRDAFDYFGLPPKFRCPSSPETKGMKGGV